MSKCTTQTAISHACVRTIGVLMTLLLQGWKQNLRLPKLPLQRKILAIHLVVQQQAYGMKTHRIETFSQVRSSPMRYKAFN